MSNKEEAENEEYERLKNSKFKQQKLPGWRPVPTITSTTIIFFLFWWSIYCFRYYNIDFFK